MFTNSAADTYTYRKILLEMPDDACGAASHVDTHSAYISTQTATTALQLCKSSALTTEYWYYDDDD